MFRNTIVKMIAIGSILAMGGGGNAHAATLAVNCGGGTGFTSVNAALRALARFNARGPNTINVRGTCNENVVVQGMNHLTLDGGNSATIVDLTGGTTSAILIDSSQEITVSNLTASGTGQGSGDWDVIDCWNGSLCRFNNLDVQNGGLGAGGAGVWNGSFMFITGGIYQNNKGWGGIIAGNGGHASVASAVSQNNWAGAVSYHGAFLQMNEVSLIGNDAFGAEVYNDGHLVCNTCTISSNGTTQAGDGINVRHSSTVSLVGQGAVTGNGGAGVTLKDLSSLVFDYGTMNVSGNFGAADVFCQPNYTTVTINAANVGTISGCP